MTGVVGIVGSVTGQSVSNRYTLQNSLGCTWGDSWPTGYGVCDQSHCRNHNAGPWITSVHSGDCNSGGSVSECDLTSGNPSYSHRGDYDNSGTHVAGATAIWLR